MKIYCIKLDAMPFCSDVLRIQDKVNGHLVRQVSGCFTTETMVQMLTGKHSSLLQKHGIGYTTWMDYVKDMSKAVGRIEDRPMDGVTDWPWIKESIPLLLRKKGFKCTAKNPSILCGLFGFIRYPDFYKRITLSGRTKEIEYTEQIQSEKNENILHFISYSHFHSACDNSGSKIQMEKAHQQAGKNILDLFSYYDFSEPDTLFWIYSDHGPWRHPDFGGYPKPINFFTWAIIKDNTELPVVPKLKVISAKDFFQVILSKFDNTLVPFTQDKNKIYITEDGRLNINPKKSTTAIACKFLDWESVIPTAMRYLIYHKPDNRFLQKDIGLDENGFVLSESEKMKEDEELMDALLSNFNWIKK